MVLEILFRFAMLNGSNILNIAILDESIVVTGGGSGIGLQIARDLWAEGAVVHILGRNLGKLEQARGAISSKDDSGNSRITSE